jgi:hypothetical protein
MEHGMALIRCPDCNKRISPRAPTCPGCGAPIASAGEAAGSGVVQLQTIQGTSKELKKQRLQALGTFLGGFLIAAVGGSAGHQSTFSMIVGIVGVIMIIGGGIWYLTLGAKIWWHHS